MNVVEAIESRRSVRAFLPTAVPGETVRKILEISARAPSGTNTQPWFVYAVAGQARDKVVADAMQLFDANAGSTYEDERYYPEKWNDLHAQRRRTVGWDLYGLLGIKKGERDKTRVQHARNYRLFDAPVGLFFFTDTYLERGSWLDIGLLIETVMIAAREFGLHTCPQACWIPYAETVRRSVGAPEGQVLTCGMALGYEDTSAVENTLVSERESFDNFVTMKGFE
jgi:nitroreductase